MCDGYVDGELFGACWFKWNKLIFACWILRVAFCLVLFRCQFADSYLFLFFCWPIHHKYIVFFFLVANRLHKIRCECDGFSWNSMFWVGFTQRLISMAVSTLTQRFSSMKFSFDKFSMQHRSTQRQQQYYSLNSIWGSIVKRTLVPMKMNNTWKSGVKSQKIVLAFARHYNKSTDCNVSHFFFSSSLALSTFACTT